MARTKTTVLVDRHLLDQFRRLSSVKHGTPRALSLEFEEAIRAFSPPEILSRLAERLGLKIEKYPSLDEIAQRRPRAGAKFSAARVVREMRDGREQRVLGHK